jgi:hypothetical protein
MGVKSGDPGGHAVSPPLQADFSRKTLSRNFHMVEAEHGGAPSCNMTHRFTSLACGAVYSSNILREQVLEIVSFAKK